MKTSREEVVVQVLIPEQKLEGSTNQSAQRDNDTLGTSITQQRDNPIKLLCIVAKVNRLYIKTKLYTTLLIKKKHNQGGKDEMKTNTQ